MGCSQSTDGTNIHVDLNQLRDTRREPPSTPTRSTQQSPKQQQPRQQSPYSSTSTSTTTNKAAATEPVRLPPPGSGKVSSSKPLPSPNGYQGSTKASQKSAAAVHKAQSATQRQAAGVPTSQPKTTTPKSAAQSAVASNTLTKTQQKQWVKQGPADESSVRQKLQQPLLNHTSGPPHQQKQSTLAAAAPAKHSEPTPKQQTTVTPQNPFVPNTEPTTTSKRPLAHAGQSVRKPRTQEYAQSDIAFTGTPSLQISLSSPPDLPACFPSSPSAPISARHLRRDDDDVAEEKKDTTSPPHAVAVKQPVSPPQPKRTSSGQKTGEAPMDDFKPVAKAPAPALEPISPTVAATLIAPPLSSPSQPAEEEDKSVPWAHTERVKDGANSAPRACGWPLRSFATTEYEVEDEPEKQGDDDSTKQPVLPNRSSSVVSAAKAKLKLETVDSDEMATKGTGFTATEVNIDDINRSNSASSNTSTGHDDGHSSESVGSQDREFVMQALVDPPIVHKHSKTQTLQDTLDEAFEADTNLAYAIDALEDLSTAASSRGENGGNRSRASSVSSYQTADRYEVVAVKHKSPDGKNEKSPAIPATLELRVASGASPLASPNHAGTRQAKSPSSLSADAAPATSGHDARALAFLKQPSLDKAPSSASLRVEDKPPPPPPPHPHDASLNLSPISLNSPDLRRPLTAAAAEKAKSVPLASLDEMLPRLAAGDVGNRISTSTLHSGQTGSSHQLSSIVTEGASTRDHLSSSHRSTGSNVGPPNPVASMTAASTNPFSLLLGAFPVSFRNQMHLQQQQQQAMEAAQMQVQTQDRGLENLATPPTSTMSSTLSASGLAISSSAPSRDHEPLTIETVVSSDVSGAPSTPTADSHMQPGKSLSLEKKDSFGRKATKKPENVVNNDISSVSSSISPGSAGQHPTIKTITTATATDVLSLGNSAPIGEVSVGASGRSSAVDDFPDQHHNIARAPATTNDTQWLRSYKDTSFDPLTSVFADEDNHSVSSSLSPPGSPPVPADEDGSVLDDTSRQGSVAMYETMEVNPTLSLWDMTGEGARPDYVVMPGGMRIPSSDAESLAGSSVASYSTMKSDLASGANTADQQSAGAPVVRSRGGSKRRMSSSSKLAVLASPRQQRRSLSSRRTVSSSRVVGDPGASALRSSLRAPSLVFNDGSSNEFNFDLGTGMSRSPSMGNLQNVREESPSKLDESGKSQQSGDPAKSLVPDDRTSSRLAMHGAHGEFARQEGRLDEALMNFTAVDPVDFAFRKSIDHFTADSVAALRWQQLIACWKHNEITGALFATPPSLHFDAAVNSGSADMMGLALNARRNADSVSSARHNTRVGLHGIDLRKNVALHEMANLDGLPPSLGEASIHPITSFMPSLGAGANVHKGISKDGGPLRNEIAVFSESRVADELLILANKQLEMFTALVEDITDFATEFDTEKLEGQGDLRVRSWCSVGIKKWVAIEQKAVRKYNRDARRVKDVLRGQIVFSNETALVCALAQLNSLSQQSLEDDDEFDFPPFSICRVKNLFRVETKTGLGGSLVKSNLPTGYRHVLVTLRLGWGLLAEIQFQLAEMYEVLGEAGHKLHVHISELGGERRAVKLDWNDVLKKYGVNVFPSDDPDSKGSRPAISRAPRYHSDNREFFLDILGYGAEMVSMQPRDLAGYSCLGTLLVYTVQQSRFLWLPAQAPEALKSRQEIIAASRQCLFQGLTLSMQSTSAGMTSWLEQGSSRYSHVAERPFELLHDLACSYARLGRWNECRDILFAMLLRCEQQLPLYHPLTLVCMLDLAAAACKSSSDTDGSLASNLVAKVAQRAAFYLSEVENDCLARLGESVSLDRATGLRGSPSSQNELRRKPVFQIDPKLHALEHIESFVLVLQKQLSRDLLTLLAPSNELVLMNQMLVADSLAVLANCRTAAEAIWPSESMPPPSLSCWQRAFVCYRRAFEGFAGLTGMDEAMLLSAAHGMARCLRQIGERERALSVLSSVVGKWKNDGYLASRAEETMGTLLQQSVIANQADRSFSHVDKENPVSQFQRLPSAPKRKFLPPRNDKRLNEAQLPALQPAAATCLHEYSARQQTAYVSCLWLMAVMSVEGHSDDKGKSRALGLLRACSKYLQFSLASIPKSEEAARGFCVGLLRMVEEEARGLMTLRLQRTR